MRQEIEVLDGIIHLASEVAHPGVKSHLRAAFVVLSRSIVDDVFGPLPIRDSRRLVLEFDGPSLTKQEGNYVLENRKLDAIKSYKMRVGATLSEAKAAVDKWLDDYWNNKQE